MYIYMCACSISNTSSNLAKLCSRLLGQVDSACNQREESDRDSDRQNQRRRQR